MTTFMLRMLSPDPAAARIGTHVDVGHVRARTPERGREREPGRATFILRDERNAISRVPAEIGPCLLPRLGREALRLRDLLLRGLPQLADRGLVGGGDGPDRHAAILEPVSR
jgi:hypothetical protein